MTPEHLEQLKSYCVEKFGLNESFSMSELETAYQTQLNIRLSEQITLSKKYFALEESFTMPELNSAYKSASLKYHPDKGGNQEDFVEIGRLYNNLKALKEDPTANPDADFVKMKQVYKFTKDIMEKMGLQTHEKFPVYDLCAVVKRLYGTIPFCFIITWILITANIKPIVFGIGLIYCISKIGFLNFLGGIIFTGVSFVGLCRLLF